MAPHGGTPGKMRIAVENGRRRASFKANPASSALAAEVRPEANMSQWGGALGNLAQELGQSALGSQVLKALGPAVLSTVVEQLNQRGLGAR